eukprot:GGOE01014757.1.p1 GENE.GGOE01014757.1~~GGOE01014757.1.p1  ORF type:complete len:395 (-),score=38.63 GGOE01014757.1:365-1549(-)
MGLLARDRTHTKNCLRCTFLPICFSIVMGIYFLNWVNVKPLAAAMSTTEQKVVPSILSSLSSPLPLFVPHRVHATRPVRLPSVCNGYITITPDTAGLGHSQGTRNSALLVALATADLGLCFAHPPLHTQHMMWESFLGFGHGFTPSSQLQANWEHIQLRGNRSWPLSQVVADIRQSEARRQGAGKGIVVYHLGQHQDTIDHCASASILRANYLLARATKPAQPLWDVNCWNVALHIRRGDVNKATKVGDNARVQPNSYFKAVVHRLDHLLTVDLTGDHRVCYHVITQGNDKLREEMATDFPKANVHMNTEERRTFHSFVVADIFVGSRSRFSHLPAMLSDSIKLMYWPFHYAFCDDTWVRVAKDGSFNETHLLALWAWYTTHHRQRLHSPIEGI